MAESEEFVFQRLVESFADGIVLGRVISGPVLIDIQVGTSLDKLFVKFRPLSCKELRNDPFCK